MADLQSKMNAHQDDIDRAKAQIEDSTHKADMYLTQLTKRVEEYQKTHSNFEPAGEYLKSALDASRSATQKLKTQGKDLSERSVPVAVDGMQKVRESLDELQKQAVVYDDKYAGSRGQHAVDTVNEMVNSGRQHATDALETASEQLMKLRDAVSNMAGQTSHGVQVAVGEAVRAAQKGDEKLGVSTKAGGVVQKVRELDERLGVTATVAKVDTKVTGGLGCKVATTTVDMVSESVNYLAETLQNAKLAAEHSDTAQSAEAKAASAADRATQKKDEVVETFVTAYEEGEHKVDEGKEMAKEKVGMATDKTERKASDVKEMAKDKAGQAKEKTQDAAGAAKDKANQATESTKETAQQAKETAEGKAGEVKDSAQDKAGQARATAEETAGMAKEKTDDVKEKAKAKAGDTKGGAREQASQSQEKAQSAVGQAVSKAGDMKDAAKEKLGSVAEQASGAGASMESKTMKSKEPTTTQGETNAEKMLEGVKQTQAKPSEAAKTAAGEHFTAETTSGQHDQPGFEAAQQQTRGAKRAPKGKSSK